MNASHATSPAGFTRRVLLALAVFLVVVGAKLVVIERSGTDLPFWDQWAKEGELTHAPWLERGELWKNLFTPHNEHRIAPTLATNLALVATSGQWDARVQCVVSGALHALLLAALFLWASGQVSPEAKTVSSPVFEYPSRPSTPTMSPRSRQSTTFQASGPTCF